MRLSIVRVGRPPLISTKEKKMQFLKWLLPRREVTGFADFPNTPLPELKEADMPKEMLIVVDRYVSNKDATLSNVYIDGQLECQGLEDEYRLKKVPGQTRIPAGRYKMRVRTVGGFHNRYSQMFPTFHKGMLEVVDVPNFTYILHHIGNYHTNTRGCLLVGSGDEKAMAVWMSKNVYRRYYKKVIDAALEGRLWVEYRDNDGV